MAAVTWCTFDGPFSLPGPDVGHSRLTVDLDALAANFRVFRARSEDGVAAVVKADAYGLGMAAVSRRLHEEGCRRFFVATEEEGLALRRELPRDCEVYVFSGEVSVQGLIPVANQPSQLRPGPVALHVDTGMHRLGFVPEEVPGDIDLRLLLTHLACADTPNHPRNEIQLERFEAVAARFPGVPVSIGNSAGILNGVRGVGRPGIGLYGGNPFSDRANPMRCVATLEGQVLQLRRVPAGEPVGYGGTRRLERDAVVAVVGAGYADGVPRLLSNRGQVGFGGGRLPILGRVSMDLTHVDATGAPVERGDWVEFFGPTLGIDEVAAWAETIAYEVLTGVGARVERRYATSDQAHP